MFLRHYDGEREVVSSSPVSLVANKVPGPFRKKVYCQNGFDNRLLPKWTQDLVSN